MNVHRYKSSDDKPVCPNCGYEAFCVIDSGGIFPIDTIGQIHICSTDEGTYLHSWKPSEVPDDVDEKSERPV